MNITEMPGNVASALSLKEEANRCFNEKRYHAAIELYTKSLQARRDPLVFGNRAQAHLNLKHLEAAVIDCNAALLLDPTYAKGLYRDTQELDL